MFFINEANSKKWIEIRNGFKYSELTLVDTDQSDSGVILHDTKNQLFLKLSSRGAHSGSVNAHKSDVFFDGSWILEPSL